MNQQDSPRISVGDEVYYKGYLAKVLAPAGHTWFLEVPKYLIDPYPDQMKRTIVKATKLLKVHV
jgi:hypothetical protein